MVMKLGDSDKLFLVDVEHYSKQKIILRYASKMHRFFYKLVLTQKKATHRQPPTKKLRNGGPIFQFAQCFKMFY